jgi:uncharacterized protein
MYDSNSKGISYTAGFFILIAFCVAGLVIGGLISIPIWTAMTGKSLKAMQEADPADANAFKVIQAVSTMVSFFIPAIITAMLLNKKPFRLMGFLKKVSVLQIFLVLLIMLSAAFFASGSLGYANRNIPMPDAWQPFFQKLEDQYFKQVNAIMQLKNPADFMIGLVIMAFLPAMFEEALFRGGLQNFLSRSTNKPVLSIIIVSVIFSIVHLSFYGFLPRMFLGIALGLIYYYTGSLWLCITGHFFNNALALTGYYFSNSEALKQITEEGTSLSKFYIGLLSLPVFILLLVVLKRNSGRDDQGDFSLNDIRDKAPWEIDDKN